MANGKHQPSVDLSAVDLVAEHPDLCPVTEEDRGHVCEMSSEMEAIATAIDTQHAHAIAAQ